MTGGGWRTRAAQRFRAHPVVVRLQLRRHFDPAFYLALYTDVAEAGVDPLDHFIRQGWREGRDPSPAFSTLGYLTMNPDVAVSGVNPLWHWVRHGRREGRAAPASTGRLQGDEADRMAKVVAPAFDATFYLATNPDVAASGADPLSHFMADGWRERRDPNRSFSVGFYLDAHPDVRAAGVNPFWHYLVAGRDEGRIHAHPLGARAEVLRSLRPLAEEAVDWRRADPEPPLLTARAVAEAIATRLGSGSRGLVLAITHDDYRTVAGGVQAAVRTEEAAALGAGYGYLGAHPWQPLNCLADEGEDPILCLTLMAAPAGHARTSALAEGLAAAALPAGQIHLVIHSLLGHSPEGVARLSALRSGDAAGTGGSSGQGHGWFWLHDHFSLCPNFTLQRNRVAPCNAPPPSSAACGICITGPDRPGHLARLAKLFGAVPMTVVAPSRTTLDLWTRASRLPRAATVVLPHLTIAFPRRSGPEVSDRAQFDEGPIRVAYLGAPFAHKGWPVFVRLAERFARRSDIAFHYLGQAEALPASVKRTPVAATAADPDAMARALREVRADIVLHWSSSPETFSFTTYEAFAAGALVLTNDSSGNVTAAVRQTGRGRVLHDEDALSALFESPDLAALAAEARHLRATTCAVLTPSRMTLDLISPVSPQPADGAGAAFATVAR